MSNYETTRFYWLQLMEDFFDEDAIDWLEEQPNGKEYSLFYLKLCLKSLRTNGVLIRQVGDLLIPYEPVKLAEMTKTNVDTVTVAISLLVKIGLVKILENGGLYLTQVENMIGSQSKGAFKKQQQRLSGKAIIEIGGGGQMSAKCPPEEEKEEKEIETERKKEKVLQKEIKKEKEKKKEEKEEDVGQQPLLTQNYSDLTILSYCNEEEKTGTPPYKEIIDYLNEKIKTHYLPTTPKTQTFIRSRWREGFTLENFKTVIDKKCNEWLKDSKMRRYLRPETLFGTKFESYLNEKPRGANLPSWYKEQNNNAQVVETKSDSLESLKEFFKPKDN